MDKVIKPRYKGQLTIEYQEDLFRYLLSNLNLNLDDNQILILRKAYNTAFEAHRDQFRKVSKEPYITHPVEVALIVANEMGLDFIAVIAALLHDVLEDSDLYDYEYIKKEFGEAVALTVEGVTKMTRVGGKARPDVNDKKINEKLATFKKLILSISKEYRVILIKIADRLHNMRTMAGMPIEKQKAKSAENLYIYAKFAEAIGMFDIKNEMEDLSFQYLFPEEYERIKKEVEAIQPYRDLFLEKLKTDIYSILSTETNYIFSIERIKNSYYSLWEKLNSNPGLSIAQIYNHESLRIIVNTEDRNLREVVFNIFVKITDHFPMRANSLRDWIRNPKSNGFRALVLDIIYRHEETAKILPQLAEIQIISQEDNIIAHKGANFERLKQSIDTISEDESITEFINRIISQLNTDFIYVFTPAGEIHKLPKKATVIDFAFKIHTDLGLHCLGAKIQGVGAKPPTYRLNSGDMVEVLHSENKEPEYEWLKVVVTDKARRELINYFKRKQFRVDQEEATTLKKEKELKINPNFPFIIDSGIDFKIANCCKPIPGDEAVAIEDENGKIIVHRADCKDLTFHAEMSPSGIAKVEWRIKEIFYDISISAMDRRGLLKDMVNIIDAMQLNLTKVQMNIDSKEELVNGTLTVKINYNGKIKGKKSSVCKAENPDDEQSCENKKLHNLINKLQKVQGILSVNVSVHHEQ